MSREHCKILDLSLSSPQYLSQLKCIQKVEAILQARLNNRIAQ
jgi:hypothetical protein